MRTVQIGKLVAAALVPVVLVSILFMPSRARALNANELINYFVQELTPYGRWEDRQPYGRVWAPSQQTEGWRPYSQGHWVYSRDYGWVWKPDEEWGEIPYHYGRWANSHNSWFWVPDDTWGPAWVDWREDDDYIGWSPLPPEAEWSWRDEWRPHYNAPNYAQNSYVFIPRRHFGSSQIHSYIVPESQMAPIYQRSRNITLYRTINQTVVNEGPRRELIERATGERLNPVHYEPRSIHGRELPAPVRRHEETRARPPADETHTQNHPHANVQEQDVKAHLREAGAPKHHESSANEPPRLVQVEKVQPNAQKPKRTGEAQQVDRGRKEAQGHQVSAHTAEARPEPARVHSGQQAENAGKSKQGGAHDQHVQQAKNAGKSKQGDVSTQHEQHAENAGKSK